MAPFDPRLMFVGDLPLDEGPGGEGTAELLRTEHVCVPGTRRVRSSVLATVADILAGTVANPQVGTQVALTVGLALRDLQAPGGTGGHAERLLAAARVLKAGRTTSVAEVAFTDPGSERPLAIATATFASSPRPGDVMELAEADDDLPPSPGLVRPFAEQLGARVVRPGLAEVEVTTYLRQATGALQGGVTALLAELAAASVLGAPVVDLDVHYLATVRVGPARATATALDAATARVEVRDAGADDRLGAVVLAATAR